MKQQRTLFWVMALLMVTAALMAACAPAAAPSASPESAPAESSGAGEAAAAPAGEKTIIWGVYQEPEQLNAAIRTQTVANDVAALGEEGLVNITPEGTYAPELAKEVPSLENGLVSEDGLTVTYPLVEGAVWSDGEPFTCDDVKFTWEAVTNPESGSVLSGFDTISSVECPDDYTAVVTHSEFYAPFLGLFTFVFPRHATGDPALMQEWDYNRMPVSTGPFKLTEWKSGDQMIWEKNENYRGAPDLPKADRVIVRVIPSREVGKALITSGEIDILWDLTEADVVEFEGNPEVTVQSAPGAGTERLVLNLADPTLDGPEDPVANPHPLLGDLRVRQAIQYGIDKQFIVDELLFGATTVGTNELSLGWAKCDVPASEYSPEKAMALLDEAGFTDQDGDGVRECHDCMYAEEGTPLRLKYQTTSGNQLREESQQLVSEMMADIGIEFYIENVPSAELFGSWDSGAFRKHGQFDIVMYTTSDSLDPQSQMEGYFASWFIPTAANNGAGFNYSRWINADADEALKLAGSTPDQAARKAAYQVVCEKVAEDLPHIYLYDRASIDLTRSNILNYKENTWGDQSWNAQEWDKE